MKRLHIISMLAVVLSLSRLVLSGCLYAEGFEGEGSGSTGKVIYVDNQLSSDTSTGDYDIANRSSGGSDGDAYVNPQDAADVVEPGDVIYFREGIYTNEYPKLSSLVYLNRSGLPDAVITFMPFEDEKVIIRGDGTQNNVCGFYLDNVKHVTIRGFYIVNMHFKAFHLENSEHIQIDDNTIYGNNFVGQEYFTPPTNDDLSGFTVCSGNDVDLCLETVIEVEKDVSAARMLVPVE